MIAATYQLAERSVHRIGFGAMQLTGPGVVGPPHNRGEAIEVLRRAVECGVNHIDTAQFYGPNVANELIREALSPYPEDLVLVSKVGTVRNAQGGWLPAQEPDQLRAAVEANLVSLGLDRVPVVNLRRFHGTQVRFEEQLGEMSSMREEGLIGAIGLSNVSFDEYRQARSYASVACVQNQFNVADRRDQELVDACHEDGVAFVPYFPLGSGISTPNPVLGAHSVVQTAERLGTTPAQVALAWLLALGPHILLIPGTSSLAHLDENLAATDIDLDAEAMAVLDAVGQAP